MEGAAGVWEITWSFSGPDGRATFEYVDIEGELAIRWRRMRTRHIQNAVTYHPRRRKNERDPAGTVPSGVLGCGLLAQWSCLRRHYTVAAAG